MPKPLSQAHELVTRAGLFAFAALLIVSPSMWQWLDVERRLPPVFSGYTDFFIYPSDLFLVLTIVLSLGGRVISGKRVRRGPWYLTIPLTALVILSFISAILGVDPALTFYQSLRFLLLLGLYLAIINLPLSAAWVAIPLALAVLIQSLVGILQFVFQGSVGLYFLGELKLNPADTGASILRIGDARFLRAYGLTDHPNLLGGFLAFALIIILGYYFALARSRLPTARRARYWLLVPLVVGALALFYTFSRAAQLALGIGVVVLLVALLREQTQRLLHLRDLAILAALLIIALGLPVLTNQRLIALRVGQENAFQDNVSEARSLNERDVLTDSANRVFYQRQFLGVGNGALPLGMYWLDKDFPKDAYDYQPAHLVVLVAAAELGLPGGFLWIWLMFSPLAVIWRQRALVVADPWKAGIAAVVLVMLVVGLFDYYPWLWQSGRIWQWSAWGVFAAVFAADQDAFANPT